MSSKGGQGWPKASRQGGAKAGRGVPPTSRFVSSRGAPDDPRGGQGWPEASCQGGPRLARGERLMSSHRVAGHQRELLMIQEGPRLAQGKSPRGGQGWLEECRLRLVPSGGHVTSGVGRRAPVGHRAPTQERRRRNSAGGEMSTGVSSGRNRKRLRGEVQWWVPGGCSAVRGVCAPCTARRVHGSRASGLHRSAGGEMSAGVSFGRNRKRLRDEVRWWVPGGCSVVRGVRAPCTARRVARRYLRGRVLVFVLSILRRNT